MQIRLGQPIRLLIPTEKLREQNEILEQVLQSKRTEHFETSCVRKDGQLIEVSVTISPIVNAHGHVVGASQVARAIDEHSPRRAPK